MRILYAACYVAEQGKIARSWNLSGIGTAVWTEAERTNGRWIDEISERRRLALLSQPGRIALPPEKLAGMHQGAMRFLYDIQIAPATSPTW